MSEARDDEVRAALRKGGVFLLTICAIIAIGTFLMVKALGLDSGGGSSSSATDSPTAPLPTSALPVPTQSDTPTEEPTKSAKPKGIQLTVSPMQVSPMERINLTGSYAGGDAAQLKVQRFENGAWADFPVDATVRAGTFQTWIMTSHTGPNKLRVFDPAAKKASNAVTVTIG